MFFLVAQIASRPSLLTFTVVGYILVSSTLSQSNKSSNRISGSDWPIAMCNSASQREVSESEQNYLSLFTFYWVPVLFTNIELLHDLVRFIISMFDSLRAQKYRRLILTLFCVSFPPWANLLMLKSYIFFA